MTSSVNYVDPTGHMAMHNPGGGSSVVVVPDPEPDPDTTTGASTGSGSGTAKLSEGRTVSSNDEGVIVPELNKDDSIDYMLQNPPRNFGDTGVDYIDFSYNVGPSYLGYTGGYSYVINIDEGWVAEYQHVGPYLGVGTSPVPASVQYTTGVVYGDMTYTRKCEGYFLESSFSIVGSYANAVFFWSDGGYGDIRQQGSGAETNICASAGVNLYWLTNLVYINGG